MSFQGLQPAYKAPTVKIPDDSYLLTLMNALTVRANDLFMITSALTNNQFDPRSQLLAPNVNGDNIEQYIATLNYLADIIGNKLTAAARSSQPAD